jgi:hypothetical protein
MAGWGWYYLNQHRRNLPFPLSAEPVVGHRIDGESQWNDLPKGATSLRHFKVIGDPVAVPPDIAAEVRNILASTSTYTFNDSQCFVPGMALTFGDGPNHVDVLICLLCKRIVFYRGDAQVGHSLSDEGNDRLTSIYKRLFKNEPPPP